MTKSKEQPKADDRLQFREKYIMFCATERKHMCELLGSAEKTCEILKVSFCIEEAINFTVPLPNLIRCSTYTSNKKLSCGTNATAIYIYISI